VTAQWLLYTISVDKSIATGRKQNECRFQERQMLP
jgi:hypothetical protein